MTLRLAQMLLVTVGLASCGEGAQFESPDSSLPASHTGSLTAAPGWSATGATRPRSTHTATLLESGKVLIAAGIQVSDYTYLSTAELYDPATGTWSDAPPPPFDASHLRAIELHAGKVMFAGGTLAQLT